MEGEGSGARHHVFELFGVTGTSISVKGHEDATALLRSKLSSLECRRLRRRFPVDMARTIRGHVIANRVEFAAEAALQPLVGADDVSNRDVEFFLGTNFRVADTFGVNAIVAALQEKSEG